MESECEWDIKKKCTRKEKTRKEEREEKIKRGRKRIEKTCEDASLKKKKCRKMNRRTKG